MENGQRAARMIARNKGDGVHSDIFPTRKERLQALTMVCRSLDPDCIQSIRPTGYGVVAVLTNGTTAKLGCW